MMELTTASHAQYENQVAEFKAIILTVRPAGALQPKRLNPKQIATHHCGSRYQNHIKIWQWNCRGFRGKQDNLQFHIKGLGSEAPDVIALQEASRGAELSGCTSFSPPPTQKSNFVTLVQRGLTTIQHQLLAELLPTRRGLPSPRFCAKRV